MNKKFYLIVILVLLIFNSILLWSSIVIKRTSSEKIIESQNKLDKFKDQSFYNFGLYLKNKSKLISTNVIDSIYKSSMLLYFYSNNECPSCVIDDIEAIGKLAIDDYVNNVLIIPLELENQHKKTFLDTYYKDLNRHPIFYEQDINIPRCFCLIDSTGEILFSYFPRLGYEENRNQYLDFVFNHYFSSKFK